MAKSIIKELIIVLLLCLVIILVLGILLYEYVPMAKILPNEVSYTTPESVKEELLASDEIDQSQVIMTYEVNSSDLNNYTRTQDYKPGKANPFSSYESSGEAPTENGSSNGGSGSQGSSSNNSNGSSGGSYFQDKGTK